jgi:hypothetical protein
MLPKFNSNCENSFQFIIVYTLAHISHHILLFANEEVELNSTISVDGQSFK